MAFEKTGLPSIAQQMHNDVARGRNEELFFVTCAHAQITLSFENKEIESRPTNLEAQEEARGDWDCGIMGSWNHLPSLNDFPSLHSSPTVSLFCSGPQANPWLRRLCHQKFRWKIASKTTAKQGQVLSPLWLMQSAAKQPRLWRSIGTSRDLRDLSVARRDTSALHWHPLSAVQKHWTRDATAVAHGRRAIMVMGSSSVSHGRATAALAATWTARGEGPMGSCRQARRRSCRKADFAKENSIALGTPMRVATDYPFDTRMRAVFGLVQQDVQSTSGPVRRWLYQTRLLHGNAMKMPQAENTAAVPEVGTGRRRAATGGISPHCKYMALPLSLLQLQRLKMPQFRAPSILHLALRGVSEARECRGRLG